MQNLFHQDKGNRSISLNNHYLVLFKNPRDKLQILTLAKQMYPSKTAWFIKEYEEAVRRPYGYLFVDLRPTTPGRCRLRTNVPAKNDSTKGSTRIEFLKNCSSTSSNKLTQPQDPNQTSTNVLTGDVPTAPNPVQEPPEIIPATPVQAPTQVTASQALSTMATSSSISSPSLPPF